MERQARIIFFLQNLFYNGGDNMAIFTIELLEKGKDWRDLELPKSQKEYDIILGGEIYIERLTFLESIIKQAKKQSDNWKNVYDEVKNGGIHGLTITEEEIAKIILFWENYQRFLTEWYKDVKRESASWEG
jgi:hypothetical protein